MLPSEYIKKYAKQRDVHSLENLLQAYAYGGYNQGMWMLAHDMLSFKANWHDEDILNFVFEFLAEIQFAEATIVKWLDYWRKAAKVKK